MVVAVDGGGEAEAMSEGAAPTVRGRKRIYRSVATAAEAGGHAIRLDNRVARTPAGQGLVLPTAALAEAVAAEWQNQGETIQPETMPLTQLAATAIDRIEAERERLVEAERERLVEALVAYGTSDLLCYRSDHPADLAARQEAQWEPLLQWAETALGARLGVTRDVFPLPQPAAATEALRGAVAALGTFELAALSSIVQISASLVIGLALVKGRLDAEAAFSAAMLDEKYQAERWGEDAWASTRAAGLRAELLAAARFVALARLA